MTIFGLRLTRFRVFLISLIILILMAIPTTRYIIWWILPLGSGADDIIVGICLIVLFVALFVEIWSKRYSNNPYNGRMFRDED